MRSIRSKNGHSPLKSHAERFLKQNEIDIYTNLWFITLRDKDFQIKEIYTFELNAHCMLAFYHRGGNFCRNNFLLKLLILSRNISYSSVVRVISLFRGLMKLNVKIYNIFNNIFV